MDAPLAYYSFQVLYWCGIREGELMALTLEDIDFKNKLININKTYQHLKGKDIITDPKTPKSKRIIQIPNFLAEELRDYVNMTYDLKHEDRLFPVCKSYLYRMMKKGAEEAGLKKIRVHDLRHSHVSLLIHSRFRPYYLEGYLHCIYFVKEFLQLRSLLLNKRLQLLTCIKMDALDVSSHTYLLIYYWLILARGWALLYAFFNSSNVVWV